MCFRAFVEYLPLGTGNVLSSHPVSVSNCKTGNIPDGSDTFAKQSSAATNGTKATQHRKKEASPTTTYLEQCLNDVNRFRILFRSARSNLLPFRRGTVRETSIEFSRLNKNPDWPSRMESGGVVGRRSGRVRAKGFKFLCPQAVGFVSVRSA